MRTPTVEGGSPLTWPGRGDGDRTDARLDGHGFASGRNRIGQDGGNGAGLSVERDAGREVPSNAVGGGRA